MRLIKLYILADIKSIQWMAQSEAEFNLVCEQYKEHYLQQELSELERKLVTDFITYFLAQWGPGSHAAQWYAGAHPFSLTNNQVINRLSISKRKNACVFYSDVVKKMRSLQGMEGTHKEVKANHTSCSELPLGQFIQMLEQLVKPFTSFGFSPLCIVKCLFKLPSPKKHIHNRSIFGFFFTVFKWNFKLVASMKVFLHLLH